MNESVKVFLIFLALFLFIAMVITVIVIGDNSQVKKRIKVCERIGTASNLEFLFQSKGKCGSGLDCYYQCRFVNSEGEQIIKNVK